MRRIEKRAAMPEFTSFVRHYSPRVWRELPTEISRECRRHILEDEQSGLSAYTERCLDFNEETLHIDHFRKRDLFPQLTFSWQNLLVDEHNPNYGADHKDGSNGVHTVADYSKLLDPVADDAADYFEYMFDGTIVPRDEAHKEKAEYTIGVFNLKHEALKMQRKQIIDTIRNLKKGGMGADEIKLALTTPQSGFHSVVEYFCQSPVFEMFSN